MAESAVEKMKRFSEPHESYVNKQTQYDQKPSGQGPASASNVSKRPDMSKNLGKFLHPKKAVPADKANSTIDANKGTKNSSPTQ